jgi:hypothetical protein
MVIIKNKIIRVKHFFANELILLMVTISMFLIIIEIVSPLFIVKSDFCINFTSSRVSNESHSKKNFIISNIPNLFYEPKPNSLEYNSLGIRGEKDYSEEYNPNKNNNTYRIMVVGDSVTAGKGVGLRNSYTEILEKIK